MTRSPAHWPRLDGVFLCATAHTPLPSPAVNCLQSAAAPEKEGQSRSFLVTNTSRKSLATGKSGVVKETGTCSGLETERGPRGWERGGSRPWMSCWDKACPKVFQNERTERERGDGAWGRSLLPSEGPEQPQALS